jgi:hypothetical protein
MSLIPPPPPSRLRQLPQILQALPDEPIPEVQEAWEQEYRLRLTRYLEAQAAYERQVDQDAKQPDYDPRDHKYNLLAEGVQDLLDQAIEIRACLDLYLYLDGGPHPGFIHEAVLEGQRRTG